MSAKWPDFFVIGAGKSGTTSLYDVLKQHPSVFSPTEKEPFYFSEDNMHYRELPLNKNEYLALYENIESQQITGDFSTSYFICPKASKKIYQANPDARIIIMLRDPIERSFSDYLMLKRRGIVSNNFVSEVIDELKRIEKEIYKGPFIVRTSLYYQNIKRYLDVFPANNILITYFTELKHNPYEFYERICDFLSIEKDALKQFTLNNKSNVYHETRSPFFKYIFYSKKISSFVKKIVPLANNEKLNKLREEIVFKAVNKPGMPLEIYPILRPVFMEELKKLAQIIGPQAMTLCESWPHE